MVEILRFTDPVLAARDFLLDWYPSTVTEIPDKFDWNSLLVVVSDAGGEGEKDVVLDRVILKIEAYSPDREEASETCRNVHGLLRAWNQIDDLGPTFDGTIQRPTSDPDPETRTPGYSALLRLIYRAQQFTL